MVMVALLGCDRGGLRSVVGDLELSSRTLHFEPTFQGHPATRTLVLRNGSRGDRVLSLSTQGPFSTGVEMTTVQKTRVIATTRGSSHA